MRSRSVTSLAVALVVTALVAVAAVPASASTSDATASGLSSPCPLFTVLHNDRIGALQLLRGQYRITLIGPANRIACPRAAQLLADFLKDFDGVLPTPWRLNARTATFLKGRARVGFSVRRVSGGGGGTSRIGFRCPNTFTVLHDDRIGPLDFPRGPYSLWIRRGSIGLSCTQAASLFRQFLDLPSGRLPSPWVIDASDGLFRRGHGSLTAFRAKPNFRVTP